MNSTLYGSVSHRINKSKWLLILLIIFGVSILSMVRKIEAQTAVPPTETPSPTVTPSPVPTPSPSPTLTLEERITKLEVEVSALSDKIENPPKDVWDKLNSISGLVSGVLIALAGGVISYLYRERERVKEEANKKKELAIQQVQTIQSFMPQLQSGDERAIEAALLAITALGNSKIATDLATLYRGPGSVSALSKLAQSSDPIIAKQAEKSLEQIFESLRSAVVLVTGDNATYYASGFIVNSDGYIVTASVFLPDEIERLKVTLNGQTYPTSLIAMDDKKGLVILKIENGQFPSLPFSFDDDFSPQSEIFILGPVGGSWMIIKGRLRRYVKFCVNLWSPAYLSGIAIFLNFRPRMTA